MAPAVNGAVGAVPPPKRNAVLYSGGQPGLPQEGALYSVVVPNIEGTLFETTTGTLTRAPKETRGELFKVAVTLLLFFDRHFK